MLAGVFQQGWGYAVVGAVAIVLAAMYMLRLISAVLHQRRRLGRLATRRSTCGPAELAMLVPLVALPARALGLAGRDHRALVRRAVRATRRVRRRRVRGTPADASP